MDRSTTTHSSDLSWLNKLRDRDRLGVFFSSDDDNNDVTFLLRFSMSFNVLDTRGLSVRRPIPGLDLKPTDLTQPAAD